MSSILNFNNSDYWQKVYETTLVAQAGSRSSFYYPIGDHNLPGTFSSHTLLVGASSFKAKPTWRLGFYLSMIISAVGVGSFTASQKSIPFGLTLVRFPPLSNEFSLKASIPKWHEEMSMSVWLYVGSESDVRDLLFEVEVDLNRIESKIDALNY